jgi:hypothetical protein
MPTFWLLELINGKGIPIEVIGTVSCIIPVILTRFSIVEPIGYGVAMEPTMIPVRVFVNIWF